MSKYYFVSIYGIIQCQNMIFYTWDVFSTLYPACIIPCIDIMNGITKGYWENHVQSPFTPGSYSWY